ncbi:MAG: type II toxin-antitoxin system prevent-host-death family antitoxin [Spirochaetales bacterium]|nr:type II toxin-antitoxin system prevent-host-death family antitoxin [Spirochaetales bacterium]
MIIDTITQAKAQLSALVSAVEQGEEVIIKKAGKPVAVLKKYDNSRKERKPGAFADKIIIKKDFDSLPQDLEAAFGMAAESSTDYAPEEKDTEKS